MKIIVTIILFAMMATSSFANGLSLNSIGPKALGMGGAMIGLADDYTAIYWNPAGITQLQSVQIGVFAMDIIPTGTYKYDAAGIDATTKTNHYISPNIMAYIPLLKGDLTIGVGAFVPAGLGAEWDGAELAPLGAGTEFKWSNKIAVFNISPAIAYKFNDMISVGAALNIHYAMLDMERPDDLNEDHIMDTQYDESSTGIGFGVSLGALIKATDWLSVGVSFKTKNTAVMTGDANMSPMGGEEITSKFERDLAWPMWLGGGVAIKPIENLTITIDAQWSNWSESLESIETEYTDWSRIDTMHMNWEDALQIRFGIQYDISDKLAVRGGVYHDPAPAPDETMNIIFPSNTYLGLTFGTSYKFTDAIAVDFAFEYLMGDDREIEPIYPDAMPGIHHMDIIAVGVGLTYTFAKCAK